MNKEQLDKIGVEVENDIIFITVAKYKLFMSYGKIGMDAYCLYSHYMFAARVQKTNSTWANNTYCRQGLGWTKTRVLKAKNLLYDLDLIKEIIRRNEKGQIVGKYVEVKTKKSILEFDAIDPKNDPMDNPTDGFLDTNALTNNINALTNKKKALSKNENSLIYKQTVDIFFQAYENLYNSKPVLDNKDFKLLKQAIKKANNNIDIIGKKINLLRKKVKADKNGFWAMTPAKLVWGWNEFEILPDKYDNELKPIGQQ